MKYFLDTEFLEGPQQEKFPISLFRKQTPPTIDLISIGIVAEDGREYYAISKDFNLEEAWNRYDVETITLGSGKVVPHKKKYWIRENVLKPIYNEMLDKWNKDTVYYIGDFSYKTFKYLLNIYGKSNKQIALEVKRFVYEDSMNSISGNSSQGKNDYTPTNINKIEFYAYYADYDWVVFCWLFGNMMDLPDGFPMYCKDLKQIMDEKAKTLLAYDLKHALITMKTYKDYPKQENEHNALADARWNKKLYEFLKNI